MKASITNTLLKDLPPGPVDIYDERLTGFVLRINKSGRGSYRVHYGRGKAYTLGRLTDLKPAEARELARTILGEAAKGNDPQIARKRARAARLKDFLKNIYGPWLETHRKDGEATHKRLVACFDDEFGTKRLHDITPWLVEKWKTKQLKEGKAPSTIQRDLGPLKTALNRAVEWGYIDANPIKRVKPPKYDDNPEPRWLSDDEAKRLRQALDARQERQRAERESANQWRRVRDYPLKPDLRAVPFTDHIKPIVLLALNTGMRRGELFNLQWRDVDLRARSLSVRGYGAKSGQTRHIPLNDEAVSILEGWQETTGAKQGLVFPGESGRLDNINNAWAGVLKDAGLTDFRFHDLRHTFASWLVMAGVDLNTVRDLLGHGDLKMTLRYAHLAPEVKARAVAQLSAPHDQEAR